MVAIRRKVGAHPIEAFNIITNTVAASSLRGAGFQPIPGPRPKQDRRDCREFPFSIP